MTSTPEGLTPEKLAEIRGRAGAINWQDCYPTQAAADIRALLAEVERLSGERDRWRGEAIASEAECSSDCSIPDCHYMHHATTWRERFTAAESSVSRLTERADTAESKYREEYKIVDRIWKALGITDYAGAGGREISEIVAEWKVRALTAESLLTAPSHGRDAGEVAREIMESYFAPALFSELRHRIRAAILSERAEAEKTNARWRSNMQNAWAALRMIREAIGELFGPRASLVSEEAIGPEPTDEAAAIVEALQRAAAEAERLRKASLGIPDAWLVIGAQAHQAFNSKLKADEYAGKWGKVLPLYRGKVIPDHDFTGNAPGVVGADNCQICGVWHDEHPRALLNASRESPHEVVEEQADDDRLWFVAGTITEDTLDAGSPPVRLDRPP